MDEKTFSIILKALAEKIKNLECDLYFKEAEIKSLKLQLEVKNNAEDIR